MLIEPVSRSVAGFERDLTTIASQGAGRPGRPPHRFQDLTSYLLHWSYFPTTLPDDIRKADADMRAGRSAGTQTQGTSEALPATDGQWSPTLWESLVHRADLDPGSTLVSDEHGRTLSAGAFADEAERVAAWLYARGVREGSVVSWQLPTTINALLVSVALSRLGAVQNPLVTTLREPDVEFMVRQAGSALLLVPESQPRYDHASMARRLEGRVPGLQALVLESALPHGSSAPLPRARGAAPDDVRWLYYTSGTTAVPKGARHRDSDLVAAARTFCAAVSPGPNDVISSIAPVAHIGGLVFFLGAVRSGAHLVVTESFAPLETARHLTAAGTTLCCSGLPFVQGFLEVQRQNSETRFFPDLRAFLIGGAPRAKALHEQVMETFGAKIVSGYGMTEMPLISMATLDDSLAHLAVADGRPSGVCLKITTPDGAPVPPGESGEVRVRGNSLMAGYVDANLDSEAFDEDGYFRTGDLARIDDEGFLIVTGRLKDIIIRNMENISARELELALTEHPAVREVAVIGLPDDKTGERVCAVIVPTGEPPSLQSLCDFLDGRGVNRRKFPVQLETAAELPVNSLGKLMKKEIKDAVLHRTEAIPQAGTV
ncbi:AMP-binding protein [Streptomyces canus]|uniref:class I adenylate-forming enzyme family protein n=1 Tax=Streptomyces canus TaxID=58343 RepID=UPI003253738C